MVISYYILWVAGGCNGWCCFCWCIKIFLIKNIRFLVLFVVEYDLHYWNIDKDQCGNLEWHIRFNILFRIAYVMLRKLTYNSPSPPSIFFQKLSCLVIFANDYIYVICHKDQRTYLISCYISMTKKNQPFKVYKTIQSLWMGWNGAFVQKNIFITNKNSTCFSSEEEGRICPEGLSVLFILREVNNEHSFGFFVVHSQSHYMEWQQ